MFQSIVPLVPNWGLLFLRIGLALTFLVHGLPKLNSNSPMHGIAGFTGFLTQLHVPAPRFFAWVVALVETVGAVLFGAGLLSRIMALLLAIDMLVALFAKIGMHVPFVANQTTGWELDMNMLLGSLLVVLAGPGMLSLDALLGI